MTIYEQYKEGTSTYVTWLIETATGAGWSGSIVYNDRGQVTTATILNASDYIGKQTRFTAVLPTEVWRAFRNTVRLRKVFVNIHAERPGNEEAKAGHDAFILVLEQSASKIRNSVKVSTVASREFHREYPTNAPLTLSNAFDFLNAQEANHSIFDNKPANKRGATTSQAAFKQAPTVIYAPEMDIEEEHRLRRLCFMKDVEVCLIKLETVSKDRIAGRIDLKTYAILFNATIGYVDAIERELERDGVAADPSDLLYNHCEHEGLRQMFESLSAIHRLERRGYPFPLRYLRDRDTPRPAGNKLPVVNQAWVDKELHLVELMMELYLESMVRRHTWETETAVKHSHQQPISPRSFDQGSRILVSVLDGNNPRVVTAFVAEAINSDVPNHQDQADAPLAELLKITQETSASIRRATEAGLQFPPDKQKTVDQCLSLVDYILHWPLKENKYIHLRGLSQKHPYSGMHRTIEEHIDLAPENKIRLLNSLSVRAMPDHAVDEERLQNWKYIYYSPSDDPEFLRKGNPAFTGTLLVSLLIMKEEAGLTLALKSPSLFSLCHVYNALRQTGELEGKKFEWPLLDSTIEMNKKALFLGALPTDPEAIYHRLLLAAGADAKMIFQAKKLQAQRIDPMHSNIFKKSKDRTWEFKSSPMAFIYRNYLHGKDGVTFMQTLSKLNVQIQEETSNIQHKRILTLEDRGWTAFLDDLAENLPKLWKRLDTDFINLTRLSSELFGKMAKSMLALSGSAQGSLENYELAIAMSVLSELVDSEIFKVAQKSGPQATANIITGYAKIARTVLGVEIAMEKKKLEKRDSSV